jgi:ribonucleoside-diphosphate reductase subunit M1
MPTASTAQIMGSTEAFEPITSNIYSRNVLSGNFMVVNKYLQNDLLEINLWNDTMKNLIIKHRGSIQEIDEIPIRLKQIYKTSWEIGKKVYIKMSADRGAFIDQSQSLNLFIAEPNHNILTQCHLHGWNLGLKTGMYYLRRKPVTNALQFTVNTNNDDTEQKQKNDNDNNSNVSNQNNDNNKNNENNDDETMTCSLRNGPSCVSCQ